VLSAAALLAVQPESFSYSPLGMRVVKALARAPLKNLHPSIVRLSEFCWCWVRPVEVAVAVAVAVGGCCGGGGGGGGCTI